MKHALSRGRSIFARFFECYPKKEKAKQEKPKHEFAYTVSTFTPLSWQHLSYRRPLLPSTSMFTDLIIERTPPIGLPCFAGWQLPFFCFCFVFSFASVSLNISHVYWIEYILRGSNRVLPRLYLHVWFPHTSCRFTISLKTKKTTKKQKNVFGKRVHFLFFIV